MPSEKALFKHEIERKAMPSLSVVVQPKPNSPIKKQTLTLFLVAKSSLKWPSSRGESFESEGTDVLIEGKQRGACRENMGFDEEGRPPKTVEELSAHIIDHCEQSSPADVGGSELSLTLGKVVCLEP